MYRVIKQFADLQDGNHVYYVGDKFPHNGRRVAKARLTELETSANKIGQPLIEYVKEAKKGKK